MPRPRLCRRIFLAGALASATLGRARAQLPATLGFAAHYQELLARFVEAHPGLVHEFRVFTLAGNARPWVETGMALREGEHVSFVAAGEVYLSRAANLALLPRAALWAQVGAADVFRPGTDTYSFRAANAGPLRLATLQGRWATPQGAHPAPAAYDSIEGALDVLVIRWATVDARRGFEALASFAPDESGFAAERERLRTPLVLPRGFEPLWYVGAGDNFCETTLDGAPAIALRSELSGGIIRAPLTMPLVPGLTVGWRWRVNQLPSQRAENAVPFHQYASVALEFDDGQDLSWYWSASLAADTHYRCPFPTWPGETHLVVRSGDADHGQWRDERRDVHADVAAALPRRPARITGLWLIATTVFGARPASVDFRDIAVVDAEGTKHRVFPA